jgi:hypothetical protein
VLSWWRIFLNKKYGIISNRSIENGGYIMSLSRRLFLKSAAASIATASLVSSCETKEGEPLQQAVGGDEGNLGITWDKGVCRFCGTGCGVLMGRKDGKIVASKGDPECWSNKGLNCIKGYFLAKILYGKDRLTTPLIRKNGKLVESTWDEALDLIASQYEKILKTDGNTAVSMWGSGQWTIFEGYTALKFMKAGLGYVSKDGMGSNNIDPNARMCMASAVAAFMRTFQSDEPMGSYEDIEHADTFFLWGANMAEQHPVLFSRIMDTKLKDPDRVKLVDLGTQFTRVSEEADLYLEFVPQTDLAIANYFANYIIQNNLYDEEFVASNVVFKKGETNIGYGLEDGGADIPKTAGKMTPITFEQYKEFVSTYTVGHTSQLSGVPKNSLEEAARLISDPSRKVCSYWTMGFNQHTRGTWVNQLVYNIHLLTGKISKPGSGPFSLTGQPSACGTAREVGTFVHRLPADMVVANEAHRKKTAEIWNIPVDKINPTPGKHTIEMFRAIDNGHIKLLWVQVANPFHSLPNAGRYRRAAQERDCFVIVSDVYPTLSTELADQAVAGRRRHPRRRHHLPLGPGRLLPFDVGRIPKFLAGCGERPRALRRATRQTRGSVAFRLPGQGRQRKARFRRRLGRDRSHGRRRHQRQMALQRPARPVRGAVHQGPPRAQLQGRNRLLQGEQKRLPCDGSGRALRAARRISGRGLPLLAVHRPRSGTLAYREYDHACPRAAPCRPQGGGKPEPWRRQANGDYARRPGPGDVAAGNCRIPGRRQWPVDSGAGKRVHPVFRRDETGQSGDAGCLRSHL